MHHVRTVYSYILLHLMLMLQSHVFQNVWAAWSVGLGSGLVPVRLRGIRVARRTKNEAGCMDGAVAVPVRNPTRKHQAYPRFIDVKMSDGSNLEL